MNGDIVIPDTVTKIDESKFFAPFIDSLNFLPHTSSGRTPAKETVAGIRAADAFF
jgi:hypothetical protein